MGSGEKSRLLKETGVNSANSKQHRAENPKPLLRVQASWRGVAELLMPYLEYFWHEDTPAASVLSAERGEGSGNAAPVLTMGPFVYLAAAGDSPFCA